MVYSEIPFLLYHFINLRFDASPVEYPVQAGRTLPLGADHPVPALFVGQKAEIDGVEYNRSRCVQPDPLPATLELGQEGEITGCLELLG